MTSLREGGHPQKRGTEWRYGKIFLNRVLPPTAVKLQHFPAVSAHKSAFGNKSHGRIVADLTKRPRLALNRLSSDGRA